LAAVEGFLRDHLKLIVVWGQTVAVTASTGCFGFLSEQRAIADVVRSNAMTNRVWRVFPEPAGVDAG